MWTLFRTAILIVMCFTLSNAQWTNIGPTVFIRCLETIPNENGGVDLFAGGGGMFVSTDEGAHWVSINSGLTDTDIRALCTMGTDLYAGTFSGRVFRSTNRGASWDSVCTGLTASSIVSLVSSGSDLFAGSASPGGVYYSSDGGAHWTQRNNGMTYTNTNAMAADSIAVYTANSGGIFRTTNKGMSWTVGNFNKGLLNTLVSNGQSLLAGTIFYGFFRSTDQGSSWSALANGIPEGYTYAALLMDSMIIAAVDMRLYLSTNNGTTWSTITGNLWKHAYALCMTDSSLYLAGGSGGVWKRPLSGLITGVHDTRLLLPTDVSLDQNYPNPFNPSTEFTFSIPTEGFVNLTVFDLTGQRITSLVSEVLPAGTHHRTWSVRGLTSGVYFYSLDVSSVRIVRSLIVLK